MQSREMKKIWIIVTAALAAVILAAGVLLLPVVYAGIFDAGKIVYEEEALPEALLLAPELFMDRFRYPLREETESLSEEAREVHVADSRTILGPEIYEKAFGLAGLDEEESYWDTLSAVKGESIFLIRTQVEIAGEATLLSIAMNDEMIPFLICRKSSREPSEAEVEEAVEALRELCGTGKDSLHSYVEEIDRIYETCQEYQNNVRDLYVSLLQEAEQVGGDGFVQEIGEEVPLWDCCVRGEWQVCTDGREAVLVCIMGQGNLVLYYDAVEKELCGYRIQFGGRY